MRWLLVIWCITITSNCFAMAVNISGSTDYQGTVELPEKARINQLFEKVQVHDNSFFLGAKWLRERAKPEQTKLKNGLIFDLTVLSNTIALNNGNNTAIDNLITIIKKLPATGRIQHVLDPAAVLGTRINHWLEEGDHIFFPPMPHNIIVIGATQQCSLEFSPIKPVDYYLQQCKTHQLADKNHVWIIQANGNASKQGIAPWNRKKQSFIAPGAMIFIPFKKQLLSDINTGLNEQIAEFLATQTPMENLP